MKDVVERIEVIHSHNAIITN